MCKLLILGLLIFSVDHANAGLIRGTAKLAKESTKTGVKAVKKTTKLAWKVLY